MRGRAHVKPAMTQQQAEVQMSQLLFGCPIEKLEALTVADLLRLHRVTEATAAKVLGDARKARGVAA